MEIKKIPPACRRVAGRLCGSFCQSDLSLLWYSHWFHYRWWLWAPTLLEKEKKKYEEYQLAQLRSSGAVLSNTATDGLHFRSREFCYFHGIDDVVVVSRRGAAQI
jgi:hypothetical protein